MNSTGGSSRVRDPLRYKTQLCQNWERSATCPYGSRCQFAHGKEELRARSSSATGERDSEKSASMRVFEAGRAPSPMEVLRAVEGNTEDDDDSVAARRGSKTSRISRTSDEPPDEPPDQSRQPGAWTCGECSFVNEPESYRWWPNCARCRTPVPGRVTCLYGVSSSAVGDLMGPGGERMARLRRETRCCISIAPAGRPPEEFSALHGTQRLRRSERGLVLVGFPASTVKAEAEMRAVLGPVKAAELRCLVDSDAPADRSSDRTAAGQALGQAGGADPAKGGADAARGSWEVPPAPPVSAWGTDDVIRCKVCGAEFSSRNRLFAHVRGGACDNFCATRRDAATAPAPGPAPAAAPVGGAPATPDPASPSKPPPPPSQPLTPDACASTPPRRLNARPLNAGPRRPTSSSMPPGPGSPKGDGSPKGGGADSDRSSGGGADCGRQDSGRQSSGGGSPTAPSTPTTLGNRRRHPPAE